MANASDDHEADSGSTSAVTEGGGGPEEDVDCNNDTNPTDPTDPTDSTDPTDPADPTDPTNPTNSTNSTDPIDPIDPTDPTDASNSNNTNTSGGARCNRCDVFEAPTRRALSAHMAQCQPTAAPDTDDTEMKVETNPAPDRVHRKMFECDVCNMKFSNGANMRRHKMRHTGVKPYECRVCQKRFFRKDHLAEHFTTHTKTLPYHCPICNRGFQRQIAMRAHFQNEHVGQHDLVKSCPLCSYRAGSMKSLRVHFFNRHGIDLDNPGPAGSSASLLAAATQHMSSMEGALSTLGSLSVSVAANYSDSGDSTGARSADNATPPMHFLTPHVEISMADAPASFSPIQFFQCDQPRPLQSNDSSQQNGDCPGSPQSADSNSNAPSSSHAQSTSLSLRIDETNITPSISLIPIKQEPANEDTYDKNRNTINSGGGGGGGSGGPVNLSTSPAHPSSVQMQSATSSSLSMIKVSPLKSLLREDLKRKIVSRSASSRARSTVSPSASANAHAPNAESSPTATTTNGAITSTASEQPSDSSWRSAGKRVLTTLQCIFCGIAFPDQTLYFLHKGCHSDSNPWKCNICGEQCSNVYEFNSHLLSKSHQ